MFKPPKPPKAATPPPAPKPKPIPQETDPSVREAQIEAERKGRKRKGRSSTLIASALGDGQYDMPSTSAPVLAGGKSVLG